MPRRTVSFDRAVEYYDRTRSNPESTQRRLTSVLAGELAGRGRVLEIGVGTGRVALPLHAAGVRLVGVDVSTAMMGRLVQKAGGRAPFPLVRADALRLPFAPGSFDGALAAHVLHQIEEWPGALLELQRVVRPGGVVLVDQGIGRSRSWRDAIQL